MASFNKVILMGNLTRDPDVRTAGASGMKVARLGLAVNERRKGRDGQFVDIPVFVDVDAWDRLAELCGQHLTKGSPVLVEGRLQMDTWEKDGVRHQKLKVRATAVKFLSRGDRSVSSAPAISSGQASSDSRSYDPFTADAPEGDASDIPF